MEPLIVTTPEEARAKILLCHARGKLQAQAPEPTAVYWAPNGYRCAVGALLSMQQAKDLQLKPGYALAHDLVTRGRIVGLDSARLANVQDVHDRWASGTRTEAQFLEAVACL